MPSRLALGLALATLTLASPARAQDGEKPEKERTVEKGKTEAGGAAPEVSFPPPSTRFKVLTTGIVITGAAWGIAFGASRGWPEQTCVIGVTGAVTPGSAGTANPIPCTSGPPGSNQLWIPIVGPWITLGRSGCPTDEPGCTAAKPIGRAFAYVIDGVVQAAGIGLIIEALVMRTESATDGAKKSSAFTMRYRGLEMMPIPLVGPGATGVSLVGTF